MRAWPLAIDDHDRVELQVAHRDTVFKRTRGSCLSQQHTLEALRWADDVVLRRLALERPTRQVRHHDMPAVIVTRRRLRGQAIKLQSEGFHTRAGTPDY